MPGRLKLVHVVRMWLLGLCGYVMCKRTTQPFGHWSTGKNACINSELSLIIHISEFLLLGQQVGEALRHLEAGVGAEAMEECCVLACSP